MQNISKNKAGLALGTLGAFIHIVWGALVYVGWAQPVLDFAFGMHSVMNPLVVLNFNLIAAIELVAIVFAVWYAVGYLFASVWNCFNR